VSSFSKPKDTTCSLSFRFAPGSPASPSGAGGANPIRFSVIVAGLNDARGIDLLMECLSASNIPPGSFEVIVVNGRSNEQVAERVRAWENRAHIRLVELEEKPDCARSLLAGTALACGEAVVVMGGDFSHRLDWFPALVEPVLNGSHDVAIGSRYVHTDGTGNLGALNQSDRSSSLGNWLERALGDGHDATPEFFAFRRDLACLIAACPEGGRILPELLMGGGGKLRVVEVPTRTGDDKDIPSRAGITQQTGFLQHLMTLTGSKVAPGADSRFAAVALLGAIIDTGLFLSLTGQGASLAIAHILSFVPAVAVSYFLYSKFSRRTLHNDAHMRSPQIRRFVLVGVLALSMRGGVLALLVNAWHIPAGIAIVPAIAAAAVILYLGSGFYVFSAGSAFSSDDLRWRVASLGIVAFAVLLRLIYIGAAQLIPDEAYYWNYAQHMDLSFFDHPPMVAWLIWAGTKLFGDNELGVRVGALLCGLIAMGYLYALAHNLYDKSTAMRAVLLLAVLPFGFVTGALMTADAPLLATWAATLYYMERALIADRRWAWLGMGIAFGLGILSKYTLGLLGVAALVFVVLDPESRRWLRRPHAYLAAGLALLLFSPVIIWNIQNGWASILFQTERATGIGNQFSVHLLFFHMLLMLTPVGLLAAVLALWPGRDHRASPYTNRRQLFVRVFTVVPLAMFFGLSFVGTPKFHWTAPVWLAVLPTIAWMMGSVGNWRNITRRVVAAWKPTIVVCLFFYAIALHYVTLGIPGVPYKGFAEHYFWQETAPEIEKLAAEIQHQTGQKPIVVGMSKWSVSAALSFYGNKADPMAIRARNMFHQSAAAYDFWYPSQSPTTRPILLVGMKPHQLEHDIHGVDNITPSLIRPGPTQELVIYRDKRPLRRVYYRVAYGYDPV